MIGETPFINLFSTASNAEKRYCIKTYQRSYRWTRRNWEDFVKTITINIPSYVFKYNIGDIKFQHTDGKEIPVVDGQQRLITLFICLCLFRNLTSSVSYFSSDTKIRSKIEMLLGWNSPVIFSDDSSDNSSLYFLYKNTNRKLDKKSIDYQNIRNNNIIKAYDYFSNLDDNTLITLHNNLIFKIMISLSETEDENESFRTFNNINTFGLKLDGSDVIIGILYEALIHKDNCVKEDIERKMSEIKHILNDTTIFKSSDRSDFYIRYYYFVTDEYIKKNEISEKYRTLFSDSTKDIQKIITDMLNLVHFEEKVRTNKLSFETCINQELSLSFVKTNPAEMCIADILFSGINDNGLSTSEKIDIFRTVDKFIVLRIFSGQESTHQDFVRGLIKTVVSNSTKNGITIKESVEKYFKDRNNAGKSESTYSSRDELIKNISEKFQLYSKRNSCIPILKRLNVFLNNNYVDSEYTYTDIDHIMPQNNNLNNPLLNTIGNLAFLLSKDNRKLQDKEFRYKKDAYSNSRIALNDSINNKDTWGSSEIVERGKYLAEKLMDLYYI